LYRPQNYCSLQIFFIQVRNVMQYVLKLKFQALGP
jgi:hypothetical protein